MRTKFLKSAFAGLILSVSGFANAGLIYSHEAELTFDGTSSYNAGYDAAYELQSPFSVAATFTITQNPGDWVRVVGRGNSGPRNYGLWYHQTSNHFLFQGYGTGNFNSIFTGSVDLNTEYTMAGVLENNIAKLYVNGVELATAASIGSLNTDNEPLTIGGAGFHAKHRGVISEVGLWDHALSVSEIANYNDNGVAVPEPSTLAIFAIGLMGLASRRFKKQY
jgi:hypothetical protein